MHDFLNASDGTISVVWNGLAHGIDGGNDASDLSRAIDNLNQCFEQSDFLKK